MFKEERDTNKFSWNDLGNIEEGRPNLGPHCTVLGYRLLQYTLRDELIRQFDVEKGREVFQNAGRRAGEEFCKKILDTSLDFSSFVADLQEKLKEYLIGILKIEKADPEFHSRFDAKKRSYLYFISKYKSPFLYRYSYFYHNKIDCKILNNLSRSLIGMKDFSSFARKNTETKNKICNIYEAHWRCTSDMIIFKVEADRFLHGMVRTITGTLLTALKNNHDNGFVEDIIKLKDREAAGEAVPAKGLFLFKVKY